MQTNEVALITWGGDNTSRWYRSSLFRQQGEPLRREHNQICIVFHRELCPMMMLWFTCCSQTDVVRAGRLFFFFAFKPRSGFTGYILITVMHEYISFLKVETASPITSPSHLAFCEITHLFAFFEFPHLHTGQHSAGQQRPVPVRTLVMRARSQQGSRLLKHPFETSRCRRLHTADSWNCGVVRIESAC